MKTVGTAGGFEAYAHRVLPLGAKNAVVIYGTISKGVCAILRRIFAIPQLAYVDDFLRSEIQIWAAYQELAFQKVHTMIDILLKLGKGDLAQRL